MKYEEIWAGRIIEEKVLEVMNTALQEVNWEERVNCIIDSAIENYDFDSWLYDYVDEFLEDNYADRIDYLISLKLHELKDIISVDDYIKWNEE